MKFRTDKPDYLYTKEIGVDIRIRGVMSGFGVMLTDCFETVEDAENFLLENDWEKCQDGKWRRVSDPKR